MGTWGSGNFDNDDANDYISDVYVAFIERIEKCLADGDCREEDVWNEGIIMPTAVILSTLYEHCYGRVPKAAQAQDWKEIYLRDYDEDADSRMNPAFVSERRAVIEATFDKLIQQAQESEKQMAELTEQNEANIAKSRRAKN